MNAAIMLDSYFEANSYITHNGKTYDFNQVFAAADSKPTKKVPVWPLVWMLMYDQTHTKRLLNADPTKPIIVVKDKVGGKNMLCCIDGLHRLAKAQSLGWQTIPAKVLDASDLPEPIDSGH